MTMNSERHPLTALAFCTIALGGLFSPGATVATSEGPESATG